MKHRQASHLWEVVAFIVAVVLLSTPVLLVAAGAR